MVWEGISSDLVFLAEPFSFLVLGIFDRARGSSVDGDDDLFRGTSSSEVTPTAVPVRPGESSRGFLLVERLKRSMIAGSIDGQRRENVSAKIIVIWKGIILRPLNDRSSAGMEVQR